MRRAWPTFLCSLALWSSSFACGDEPAAPANEAPAGQAGQAGQPSSGGSAGAAGLGGSAPAYLSGREGIAVVATRGLLCQGSCASTMSGPFLTSAGQIVVGGSLSGRFTLPNDADHDTADQGDDGYFDALAADDLRVTAQRVLSGKGSTSGLLVSAAADGIVVAGPLDGSLEVGAAAPLTGDGTSSFVAAYDAAGALRFARPVPAFVGGVITGHRSGSFALGVYAPGSVDFGCGLVDAPLGSSLVVVFDPTGACLRHRVLGGSANTTVIDAIAFGVEPDDVAVTGRFHDTLTVRDRTLTHAGEATFLLDFLADGDIRWLRKVETAGPAPRLSMVRDAFGSFVVTTLSSSSLDFGWGAKPGVDEEGGSHPHVARYDYEGLPMWHVALPATTIDSITPAVSFAGLVFVGGAFSGSIDLGDGLRESAGRKDAWLARLDNGGGVRWSVRWGSEHDDGLDGLLATENALFVRASPPPAVGAGHAAMTTVGISRLTGP